MLAACAPKPNADDPRAVPPLDGDDAIAAWFEAGHYLAWPCEPMAHDAPPHGRMRVCANAIAMQDVTAVDASVVAELVDDTGIVGRAAQRHTGGEATGDAWYWYLRDASGLAADGWGFEGPARDACAACHQTAATDFVFVLP